MSTNTNQAPEKQSIKSIEKQSAMPLEFIAREELQAKRREIGEDFDKLVEFLKDVRDNYNYDYGTAPRAIAQASVATAWYLASVFGITSFQAGFVMWDFIKDWQYRDNECGLKIVDYDLMLYPQYEYKFTEKTISEWQWEALQKKAQKELDRIQETVETYNRSQAKGMEKFINEEGRDWVDTDFCNVRVLNHWKSIVNGIVPFGYRVEED